MTKLCPRGKSAAKRKFKVYPSAYANAYASKICAGKIKDPSGVKRKDFKGPKPMNEGGDVKKYLRSKKKDLPQGLRKDTTTSAYGDAGKGRPVPPFMKVRPGQSFKGKNVPIFEQATKKNPVRRKKMMAGGFGIFSKKKKEEDKSIQEKNKDKKKKRLEELKKEIGAKKGKMMIMIAIGKPKKANKGAIMNVANKLEKASKAHAGQAKTLKSLKVRGGGMAVQGMNFKGIY